MVHKIIVEGCDGTGKTTLCKKLAEKYDLDVVHITSKDPNDFDFYRETLRKTNVVYDRHFLGELIYPKIYNRKGNLDLHDARWFRDYCYKQNVCIMVLTADLEEIKRRLTERGELKFVFENLESINKQFIMLSKKLNIRVFDTTKDSFEDICEYVECYNTMFDAIQRGLKDV